MKIFFVFPMSVIVFQIMIPISLYISMELVRVGQAYFMICDDRMLDQSSNSRFQCRALNINEDLGQIKYVFSDKTGTLTENKMEFICASVGGLDFSNGKVDSENGQIESLVQVDGIVSRPKMKVKIDLELLKLSKRKYTNEGRLVYDFFVALAACNTIVPLTMETSDPAVKLVEYQGESPDEQALVYAAASYCFMLIERTSGHVVIDIQGERQRYTLFTGFTLTIAITDWSSVLYSVIYTSFPTIVVGILVLDTLWQSVAAFFVPLLAYWGSDVDGSRTGDLWTIGVVVLVNAYLAMDVIRWYWITHAAIWGSMIATFICIIVIDALPFLPGYWAFFHIANAKLFWLCLVGATIGALVPCFFVKVYVQNYRHNDIQIAREAEKIETPREESHDTQIEMYQIF